MTHMKTCSMRLTAKMRLLSMMLITTSQAGCASQAFDAQKGAAQFVAMSAETAQRVGFTEERQIEILKNFGCSNIRKEKISWAIQNIDGDNCTVLGKKVPEISISVVGVSITFSGNDRLRGAVFNDGKGCWPNGQYVFDKLKANEYELSQIIFQGKAHGRLTEVFRDIDKNLCGFALRPVFD